MYYSFFLTPEKDAVEYVVIEKQGQKGMFLSPRYQVLTDANKTGNYVPKKELETIDRGDKLQGHETFEYGFFTKTDQLYDGSLLLILFVVLLFLFLVILYGFIAHIPAVDQVLEEREENRNKKRKNWFGYGLLFVVMLGMLVYTTLYTVNLFHKLVPIGQTDVVGEIIDSEENRRFTPRADYSTYELTIRFTDKNGKPYQVKKGVTSQTYLTYRSRSSIDIKYLNNNPYNIFIKTKSIDEFFGAVINIHTIIYGLSLFSFYLLFKHFRNNFREKATNNN